MKKLSKLTSIILSLVLAIQISLGVTCMNVEAQASVATVWVVSCTDGLGHAFLVVENTSSENIMVGKYQLAAGQICSVGTFGNLKDGKCLYYNAEKYCIINKYRPFTPNVALHEDITDSTLATLSNTIISNTSWATLSNCSTFAEKCWNSFSSRKLSAGWIDTPAGLSNSIKKNSGYESNFSISGSCSQDEVKYQSSKDAPAAQCCSGTFSVLESFGSSSSVS